MTPSREALHALDETLDALGLGSSTRPPWTQAWAASQAALRTDAVPFLQPAYVEAQGRRLGMAATLQKALVDGLALFRRQPLLRRLAWHCHYTFFRGASFAPEVAHHWPRLPAALGEAAPLFYAYVYLSGVPALLAYHHRLGVALDVSLDTLSDLALWIEDYHTKHGTWGLSEIRWLRRHFAGRLYKLGRLQFERDRYPFAYHAFLHRHDRRILVFAGTGMRFRADGLTDGTHGRHDPAAWTASLHRTSTAITGHPIHPLGYAQRDTVTLATDTWEEILKKDGPTLAVHIPATGPLAFEACGASFAQAMGFFPRHFPDHPVYAFTCSSWLLDPQFEAHLPATANIVRFLREWYLTPQPAADDAQTLERVFGTPGPDLDAWPRRTALQRAVVRHMKAGGRFRMGAGLMFPQALAWGSQVFRSPTM